MRNAWFVLVLSSCVVAPPAGDAGALGDAAVPDAGASSDSGFESDSGFGGDAGVELDAGLDGGVPADAGFASCEVTPHDPLLGTARLGAGFRVVDSALLPVSYHLPLGVTDEVGPSLGVYGYMADGRVHRLGQWPSLAVPLEANVAFDAVNPADRAFQVLTGWSLASTNGQLLAPYRTVKSQAFVGGAVARYDSLAPDAGVEWLAAPGVESAMGLGSYFVVGAQGLGALTGTNGVYAWPTSGANAKPVLAATYPTITSETVRPGLMAVTTQGVVVMGYYLDVAARQVLRLPPSAALMTALSGGPPVVLEDAPELTSASDIVNATGFGPGVAVLHSTASAGALPVLGRLLYYPLTPQAGGAVVGPATNVLTADDSCTVVSQLVSARSELLVGLWDKNGQRVIRVAPR